MKSQLELYFTSCSQIFSRIYKTGCCNWTWGLSWSRKNIIWLQARWLSHHLLINGIYSLNKFFKKNGKTWQFKMKSKRNTMKNFSFILSQSHHEMTWRLSEISFGTTLHAKTGVTTDEIKEELFLQWNFWVLIVFTILQNDFGNNDRRMLHLNIDNGLSESFLDRK